MATKAKTREQPAPEPLTMTTAEFARHLHVNSETVTRWLQQGRCVAPRRVPGGLRFIRAEVESWLSGLPKREPTPPAAARTAENKETTK